MHRPITHFIKDNRGFILFLLLMFVFRSVIADWNTVPTGSMKPTIIEGDRILVNKMAYDLRIPFTHISLLRLDDPQRGDIAIFDSEVSAKRLVKRVIGVPGDLVAMQDNRLTINGRQLPYRVKQAAEDYADVIEDLLGTEHDIRVYYQPNQGYNHFGPLAIPEDHYLMLGDNRDHSADSRMIGLVPRAEIVGRSRQVVMSLNYENFYLPRRQRFFKPL